MPILSGIFARFININQVPIADINKWLKVQVEPHILQNYIGNRILYSQTVAATAQGMEVDFAILREVVKRNPTIIYKDQSKKIFIPADFILRFPPLPRLVLALMDVLTLPPVAEVVVSNPNGNETVGTILKYKDIKNLSELSVLVDQEPYKCQTKTTTIIPINRRSAKVKIGDQDEVIIRGGILGVIIDLR